MQTLIGVVLTFAALKATAPILAPFLLALFLIAIVQPLQRRFQRRFSRTVAIVLTLCVFLMFVGLFVGALWFSGVSILQKWPQYAQTADHYLRLAADYGVPIGSLGEGNGAPGGLASFRFGYEALLELAEGVAALGAAFTLVIAYLVMGLLEIDILDDKLRRILSKREERHWLEVAATISTDCRRYLLIRTAISLLSGILIGIATWLIGLDFVFIWGLLAFLFKYIPTLGSIVIGLLPPLFALVQFGDWRRALITLLAITAVQSLQGNIINPLLQGKYLAPSPLVIVLSVVFWGWLWGVAGAFLAVPLTILIVVTCRQFQRTRWIATLLAYHDDAP
ncbi:MAG: AI-2E family transporter [Caldilineaceae bacterium]